MFAKSEACLLRVAGSSDGLVCGPLNVIWGVSSGSGSNFSKSPRALLWGRINFSDFGAIYPFTLSNTSGSETVPQSTSSDAMRQIIDAVSIGLNFQTPSTQRSSTSRHNSPGSHICELKICSPGPVPLHQPSAIPCYSRPQPAHA